VEVLNLPFHILPAKARGTLLKPAGNTLYLEIGV